MSRARDIVIALVMVWMASTAHAQLLTFDRAEWDFGNIKEVDGVVCHQFKGTNTGSKPIIISRVTTSCGCTTTDYPTKPIKPQESFEIKVCFDPTGRPEEFSKSINIILNDNRREVLTIKGYVEPRPRSIEDDYPYYMVEGLRVGRNTFGFGTIQHGNTESSVIPFVNTSNKTISPRVVFECESGLLKVQMPRSIAPAERGQINITYDLTQESSKYGRMVDKFAIEVDGKRSHHSLYATSIIVDNFDTSDYDNAPIAGFSRRSYDFGEIAYEDGKSLTYRVELKNEGKEALIIRWIENKPQHFFVTLQVGTHVESGSSITFDAVLKPDAYGTSDIADAISIITNDPFRPYTQLKVRAKIVSK